MRKKRPATRTVSVRANPDKMAAVTAKGYTLSEVFRFGLDVYTQIGDALWLRDFKAAGEYAREQDRTRPARTQAAAAAAELRSQARDQENQKQAKK
jgi:hypothetical protein